MIREESWKIENGNYKCPECGKEFSPKGICSHIIFAHKEDVKERLKKVRSFKKNKTPPWNKGLTKETDERLMKKSKEVKEWIEKNPEYKNNLYNYTINNKEEHRKNAVLGGLKSAASQKRRSKNEILFSEMCSSIFSIITNEPIFNGWDADIIIEEIKIAILWNGIWHYKQISKKQSLKQVMARDKIKISQIKECGYTPYIIKDLGKYNFYFVKEEFEKFCDFANKLRYQEGGSPI